VAIRDALSRELKKAIRSYLGVSVYQPESDQASGGYGRELDDPDVERTREAYGGNIQPLPTTKTRWYMADLESAQHSADAGFLREPARLCASMRRDGTYCGLMGTRTQGLVHLPKRFYGDTEVAETLRSKNGSRSVFDEMFPQAELALLAKDGIELGIGIAELLPVRGRSYPVMVRLEPEFLYYLPTENRWYYASIAGNLPVDPGNGRWVLHVPGGRLTPWRSGNWLAGGRSYINKEHAINYRANYVGKLANPARVAVAPQGATENQRVGFFKRVLAWATNTVLEVPPGWDVKLIESNGRGWEVFQKQIDTSDLEFMIMIAGQIVTTTGGMGFGNAKYPDAIRRDIIQGDAEALAYTIYTQGLPQFVVSHWGINALNKATVVEWETGTPADRETEARTMGAAGTAIKLLTEALLQHGQAPRIAEISTRLDIPTEKASPELEAKVESETEVKTAASDGADASSDFAGG
jgi:hypothetical protein